MYVYNSITFPQVKDMSARCVEDAPVSIYCRGQGRQICGVLSSFTLLMQIATLLPRVYAMLCILMASAGFADPILIHLRSTLLYFSDQENLSLIK